MDMLEILKERYRDYDEKAAQVKKETKGVGGIWGMGEDPRAHHCHDVFYEGVGQWVRDFLATGPTSDHVMSAAKFILGAADERREQESYWYTYAAQGHVKSMIPWLAAADCKALADWYDTRYTKLERLPVQRELYKLLRKSAKG